MTPDQFECHVESAVLRREAMTLRRWSVAARRVAGVSRSAVTMRRLTIAEHPAERAPGPTRVTPAALPPRPGPDGDAEAPFGLVSVTELFSILIDDHQLSVRVAGRRLVLALAACGYPSDCDAVSPSDALDIVEAAARDA